MLQKLYSLVAGKCQPDNPDSVQLQEILVGGHLYLNIIKEKLVDLLAAFKLQVQTDIRRQPATVNFSDSNHYYFDLLEKYIQKVFNRLGASADIGRKLEYFLATGNLVSNTGLDLQQV